MAVVLAVVVLLAAVLWSPREAGLTALSGCLPEAAPRLMCPARPFHAVPVVVAPTGCLQPP